MAEFNALEWYRAVREFEPERRSPSKQSYKLFLFTIYGYLGSGEAFVGYNKIHNITGLSNTTIAKCADAAVCDGFLEIVKVKRKSGFDGNLYRGRFPDGNSFSKDSRKSYKDLAKDLTREELLELPDDEIDRYFSERFPDKNPDYRGAWATYLKGVKDGSIDHNKDVDEWIGETY